jgi:hypothetical protein
MYINGLVFTDLGIGSVDASTGFVNETLPPLHNLILLSGVGWETGTEISLAQPGTTVLWLGWDSGTKISLELAGAN